MTAAETKMTLLVIIVVTLLFGRAVGLWYVAFLAAIPIMVIAALCWRWIVGGLLWGGLVLLLATAAASFSGQ